MLKKIQDLKQIIKNFENKNPDYGNLSILLYKNINSHVQLEKNKLEPEFIEKDHKSFPEKFMIMVELSLDTITNNSFTSDIKRLLITSRTKGKIDLVNLDRKRNEK